MAVILMYHSVCERVVDPWIEIRPSSLIEQIEAMGELGFAWVGLRQAIERRDERVAAVTFDDGLEDFLDAAPILRERSIPITQFVCPGLWGRRSSWASQSALRGRRLLDADELRSLVELGVELGCHGLVHEPFTDLGGEPLGRDLDRALELFERHLGLRPRHLAYPFGRCDEATVAVVRARFDAALAVDPPDGLPWPYALPRICGREGMGRDELEKELGARDLASAPQPAA